MAPEASAAPEQASKFFAFSFFFYLPQPRLYAACKNGIILNNTSNIWARDCMNKFAILMMAVILLSSVAVATSALSNVTDAVKSLCRGLKDLLPVAAMLMIVVAGVIYAAGQVMGAETRARANVWATAALTGALIAVLIYAVAPAILGTIYNGNSGSVDSNVCN
jgi:hypothetical protein